VIWKLRSARPKLKLLLHAVDISNRAIEVAKAGVYLCGPTRADDASIFERMSDREIREVFERDGDTMTVRAWLRDGIQWHVADVGEAPIHEKLGLQDIVIANNFLCHMDNPAAEKCLRTIAQLAAPGGYMVVSGVDLDLRTKVAKDLRWSPVQELIPEIHEGDPCMRRLWPCHYGGLEALNKARSDWTLRYAAAFQTADLAERHGSFAATEPATSR
jgi:SAM-dependent methyltransferase